MILFYIYIASLLIGGILLGASLLLGGGGEAEAHAGLDAHGDADLGADADVQLDADGAIEAGGVAEVDAQGPDAELPGGQAGISVSDFWLPFTSLRFWVFFLAFFGLTGTVLSVLGLAAPAVTLLSASGLGVLSGFAAAFVVRRLGQREIGIISQAAAHRGLEGCVLLPLDKDAPGKIRVSIGGSETDLRARSADEQQIPIGARVLLIEIKDGEALVVRAPE